jgi:hypothetical protein
MSALHRQNTHVIVLPKREKSEFAVELAIVPADGAGESTALVIPLFPRLLKN